MCLNLNTFLRHPTCNVCSKSKFWGKSLRFPAYRTFYSVMDYDNQLNLTSFSFERLWDLVASRFSDMWNYFASVELTQVPTCVQGWPWWRIPRSPRSLTNISNLYEPSQASSLQKVLLRLFLVELWSKIFLVKFYWRVWHWKGSFCLLTCIIFLYAVRRSSTKNFCTPLLLEPVLISVRPELGQCLTVLDCSSTFSCLRSSPWCATRI